MRRTVSGTAHVPVPTISLSGATPAATAASSSSMRSPGDSDVASPVVPNSTIPWQPSPSTHRQWVTNRSVSASSSLVNGVSTGANTPVRRRSPVILA